MDKDKRQSGDDGSLRKEVGSWIGKLISGQGFPHLRLVTLSRVTGYANEQNTPPIEYV